jgi:hypothetical protein
MHQLSVTTFHRPRIQPAAVLISSTWYRKIDNLPTSSAIGDHNIKIFLEGGDGDERLVIIIMGPLQETLGKDGETGSGCLVMNHSNIGHRALETNSLLSAPIWAKQSTNNKHVSPLCSPITSKTPSVVSEGEKTTKQKLTPKPTL